MPAKTQDLRIRAIHPLVSPVELQREYPLIDDSAGAIAEARREIRAIIHRRDDRLLVVVGPCSIHDPDAALEYARRLSSVSRRLARDLRIVMRVYFEKPRTVVGWKGLINDPGLDGSFRINDGLRIARRLLLEIAGMGLPAANEFLDNTIGQYFADLVSWGCIGARTVESQVHRELASGLSMPVGFKNRTDGDFKVAIDAMMAAARPHWFPSLTRQGVPAVLGTKGNRDTHLVLRGGSRSGPNFDADSVGTAAKLMRKAGRKPALLIDCSHGNSGKDPDRQPVVAGEIARQIADGQRAIIGAMIEGHLVAGSQKLQTGKALARGQSITDACLGWEDTEIILTKLASAVRKRRKR